MTIELNGDELACVCDALGVEMDRNFNERDMQLLIRLRAILAE